jgi:hypothetical protein
MSFIYQSAEVFMLKKENFYARFKNNFTQTEIN